MSLQIWKIISPASLTELPIFLSGFIVDENIQKALNNLQMFLNEDIEDIEEALKNTKIHLILMPINMMLETGALYGKDIYVLEKEISKIKKSRKKRESQNKNIKCIVCGEYLKNSNQKKYCSKKCRDKDQIDIRKVDTIEHLQRAQDKVNNEKIMECSVDCLLDELGDIE